MGSSTSVWRLSFILPDNLYRSVPRGRHAPCLHGCLLTVHGAGLVSVEGISREVVFEQAQRFLRVNGRGQGRLAIDATLTVLGDEAAKERWLLSAGRARQFAPSQPLLPGLVDVSAA